MGANLVFITLGSNVEPEKNLPAAIRKLSEHMTLRAVSKVYHSPALGEDGEANPEQGYYLNAAVLGETLWSAVGLKHEVLRKIEEEMGRERSSDKYAARPIDLDIALFNQDVIHEPERGLRIPDPDITERGFLALPLADLAPDYIEPASGRRLGSIALDFVFEPDLDEYPLELSVFALD